MNFGEQIKRIRTKLRDPDGNLWSRDLLLNLYNDVQKDLQTRTRYLESVEVLRLPPFYHMSYLHDWEFAYLSGDRSYRALRYYEQDSIAYTSRWEAQELFGVSGDISDEGANFTHPWEAFTGLTVGMPVSVQFPVNYHTTKLLAYDQKPISYMSKKQITSTDPSYLTRESDPFAYYRDGELDNSFIPYPRPSTVVWNDIGGSQDPDWVYTFDWEADSTQVSQLSGTGETWTRTDSTNKREYVFLWEIDVLEKDYGMRGMYLFELDYLPPGQTGTVLYVEGDTTTGIGVLNTYTGALFSQETGLAVEVLDDIDNFLLIYDLDPKDIVEDTDISDFPNFMRRVIEYGVVSRAYGANTDGKIKSLSDYWAFRYESGIALIKRYMSKRKMDRDYRLVTGQIPPSSLRRHPRLPDTYPNVNHF